MNNLVVSLDTYSWIKHTAGIIIKEPSSFSVLIVFSESDRYIEGYENLCPNAIYAQRSNDLYNIGTEIKIPELGNLLFNGNINVEKLVTDLTLKITLGNIRTVYYQKSKILDNIFKGLQNKINNIEIYSYSTKRNIYDIQIDLTENEYRKKLALRKYMIGVPNMSLKSNFREYERFSFLKEENE